MAPQDVEISFPPDSFELQERRVGIRTGLDHRQGERSSLCRHIRRYLRAHPDPRAPGRALEHPQESHQSLLGLTGQHGPTTYSALYSAESAG